MPATASRFLLPVLAAVAFISVLSNSMVYVAGVAIAEEFGVSSAEIAWIFTGFSLAYAVAVPLYGGMSDIYGVRRVLLFGILLFAAGGLVCALAQGLTVLVIARIVQAAGGAAVPALATVAIAKTLPPGGRGGAVGLLSSSVGVGSALGPAVGGIITDLFGWRVLFLGAAVSILLLLPLVLSTLRRDYRAGGQSPDFLRGILLGLGAATLLLGITEARVKGFASLAVGGYGIVALMAALAFALRIHRAKFPFAPPSLFRNHIYVAATAVAFLSMGTHLAALVFASMLAVQEMGLSPAAGGLILTPGAIALALLSPISGRLSDVYGPATQVLAGLAVMSLALPAISTYGTAHSPVPLALGMTGVAAGFAFVQTPLITVVANALRPSEVGAGMGVFSGSFFLGGAAGPALIGAFIATRTGTSAAFNPFLAAGATAFSDAFLLLAAAPFAALGFASVLHFARKG